MFNRKTEPSVISFITGIFHVFIILSVLIFALNCSTEKKPDSAEGPCPLKEVKTFSEAGKLTGFTPKVPASVPIKVVSRKIIVIGKTTVSVIYSDKSGNEFIYRMSSIKGDASGDYTSYPVTVTEEIKGMAVTLKGSSKESISVAVWNDSKFSYSVKQREI